MAPPGADHAGASVITADDLRACRRTEDIVDLFRQLGYPTHPVSVDAEEWRLAGIELPAGGALTLLARMSSFDLFLMEGEPPVPDIIKFMADYSSFNILKKAALITINHNQQQLEIHLYGSRQHRHLLIDCRRPTVHGVDRMNLLALRDGVDPARLFERALDREAVARQFFLRFRAAVRTISSSIGESCRNEKAEAIEDEALLILSRLLFLSFVQEKGWLNGERRFLIDRADRAVRDGTDFFSAVLRPLFFGCLNTPSSCRDGEAVLLGHIPYLNGGLFEPSPFERRNPDLGLPAETMRGILEDVFERFDFTVDESETGGTRVDPEMLGKVFESLMADDERASSGSFYTPREIVDVLVSRAIAEWVASGSDHRLRDDVLVALKEGMVSGRLAECAGEVVRRLETVTVLDPACGSGAFLLSALNAIERLLLLLSSEPATTIRQQIVERSLYGVDLKTEAVRLCELRLWLAIVADADPPVEEVRPLPNLDRNILQGNSLLSPLDFLGSARADLYREWAWGIRAQRDLIERYRTAGRDERPALFRLLRAGDRRLACDLLARSVETDECELEALMTPRVDLFGNPLAEDVEAIWHLRRRLDETRSALECVENGEMDFFAFDVHFAHVMAGGGFDIVAGNPPWVRNARIGAAARRMYRDRYALFSGSGDGPFHQPDLSVAFVERSVGLLAPGGVVSMLLPAKITNAAYAASLREFLIEETSIAAIIDWTDEGTRHFTADTFPLGLVLRRGGGGESISIGHRAGAFTLARSDLAVRGGGSEWSLVPPDVGRILRRLRDRFAPLEETLGRRPVMGVKTGDNRSFFLDAERVDCGFLSTTEGLAIPTEFVCRCVRGRDMRRWSARAAHWMLWPPAAGWKQPPLWLQQIARRRGVEPEVLELSYVRPEHVGVKVAWKDVSRGMAAAVLPDRSEIDGHSFPLVPNQTLYCVDATSLDEAHAIAALLNSSIVDALLLEIAERAKDDHYRYFGRTVARIPFPLPSDGIPSWHRLVRFSRAAHRDGVAAPGHDFCVADLFEVTPAELEILEAHVSRRLAAR